MGRGKLWQSLDLISKGVSRFGSEWPSEKQVNFRWFQFYEICLREAIFQYLDVIIPNSLFHASSQNATANQIKAFFDQQYPVRG